MEKEYSVLSGGERIGSACVSRCGLYYHICCRCSLTGEVLYKVIVSCGDREVDLGLCVPRDGSFGLETRIPVKRIGEGSLLFRAVPRRTAPTEEFVPICAEEPFCYLSRLSNAYLVKRDRQIGVAFQNDSSRPTGQWSEPNTSE